MIALEPVEMLAALSLFSKRPTHHIARSCCQGLVPCRAYADNAADPRAAVVVLERFGIGFAAGDAAHAKVLLGALRGWHSWYEIIDPPEDWHPALADWSRESHATSRYAFESGKDMFSIDRLRRLAEPPEGCVLRRYDHALLDEALSAAWSEDQLGAFASPGDFLRDGLGVALVKNGRLAAGCASFCRHMDGYEIQVDTHPDHRGQGLATCVAAAFILECLARGMTPYWDAANSKSLRLAQKLDFTFHHAFTAWLLIASEQDVEEVYAKAVGESDKEVIA